MKSPNTRKIVIIGGGTAGWMTAAYLAKYRGGENITVIESDKIPKIGVGESVTPHVASFFDEIGIPVHDWMLKTGAVYKYANKFVNWKAGKGESEYFSFNFTIPENNFYKDISVNRTQHDFSGDVIQTRSIDYMSHLCQREGYDRFDRYFNPQYHYMEKNVAPFKDGEHLLNQPFSFSQHINAELASAYLCNEIAKPQGVKHIIAKVDQINSEHDFVKSIVLDNGDTITADLFIDCSGFHKVLVKQLGWPEKIYEHHPIDSAWVCQTLYEDQETEMVNYTQSIAEPHGWRFKIGLYHRMGNGYCFDSRYVSEADAKEHFIKQVNNRKAEPRLIKWKPTRLEKFGGGNVAAVGLSCGFVEPLEANALYTIITSVRRLNNVLDNDILDFTVYNEKMGYTIDDIADFILVHYTLSSRNDTTFWKDMQQLGKELNHKDLVLDKIYQLKNTMKSAIEGYTMFPDYMWAQLAVSWGIEVDKKQLNPTTLALAKLHFNNSEQKHSLISDHVQSNYQWHKENVFKGLNSNEWVQQYNLKF
jgi:tryptophan halogenase